MLSDPGSNSYQSLSQCWCFVGNKVECKTFFFSKGSVKANHFWGRNLKGLLIAL